MAEHFRTFLAFLTAHLFWVMAAGLAVLLALGALVYWRLAARPGADSHAPALGSNFTKLRRSLILALRSLWLHKLRSFLSVLGIIIGTAAVIALMGFGEGSMQDALDDIERQGATNIIIRSAKPPDDSSSSGRSFVSNYGLSERDLQRFGTFGQAVTRIVPMRVFTTEVRYLDRKFNGRLVATTANYVDVNKLEMATGRFLADEDNEGAKNICVLGSKVADRLFPFEEPLGQTVGMRSHFYKVVGVVKSRTPTGGSDSQSAEDYNRDVYIPLETSRGRIGEMIVTRSAGSRSYEKVHLSQITLTVSDRDKVRSIGKAVDEILKDEHGFKKDWLVTIPLEKLDEAKRAQERFTMLMAMIASISLLVGGIGIMNIMLATVTERTREIGIRRALGAKRKDITMQFLVEAVVQTSVGGLAGVIVGLGVVTIVPGIWSHILSWGWFDGSPLPAKIHVGSIFISIGFSIFVGVGFGLYPAWRASRLDPIEALRHD